MWQNAPLCARISRKSLDSGQQMRVTVHTTYKERKGKMNIKFNVTGAERKALVGAISEILGQPSVYQGAPTFAYAVGSCTIDKNGAVSHTDSEELLRLAATLKERGYVAELEEALECGDEAGVTANDTPETEAVQAANGERGILTIEMPLAGFTPEKLDNLTKLVESKATLIKKAIEAEDLPVAMVDDKLRFPWFTLHGIDGEADAYSRFICALCKMAKEQKRVTAKEKDIQNDRFTMRLFLIRLGFIGPEFKAARKILLRNLSGNSSWKNGQRPQ
ncbi:hypothetical protein FACS1894132_02190 [Clostridia bacterium]|nr:hypothetical protein FACS1894132_02190 [Clostridia bacterium]